MHKYIWGVFILLSLAVLSFLNSNVSVARTDAGDRIGKGKPIEVLADNALEWHRDQKNYTAKGNATLKQGTFQVDGDMITAFYREGVNKSTEIWKLISNEKVIVHLPPHKAYGDHVVYNLDTGIAILTGENLRIETPNEVITAKDQIEYDINSLVLTARGGAQVVTSEETLKANKLVARFQEDTTGSLVLSKINARDNVRVLTKEESIHGDRGTYDVKTGKALVNGNVEVYRGESRLSGDRAEIDMDKGISQLYADIDTNGTGRVRGVFYPGSQ